jgi:DNA repair exonuclease SbcCD ATPase subunit
MLTQIRLNGFRAFARENTLDLAGEAVILVGPNGSGKTSLFDGIEWGLFGKIPRLLGSRDAVGEDYVGSLFSEAPPEVALHFSRGTESAVVSRGPDGLSVVDEAGTPLAGRLAGSWIARLVMGVEGDRPAEAASVFDRTVLLGQEKIVDFVRDTNPRARFDSLSTLLGADVVRRFYTKVGTWAGVADLEHAAASNAALQAERSAEQLRVRRATLEAEAAAGAGAATSLQRIQEELRSLEELGKQAQLRWPEPQRIRQMGTLVSSLQDLVTQIDSEKRRISAAIVRADELHAADSQIKAARDRSKVVAKERAELAQQRTQAAVNQQKIEASMAEIQGRLGNMGAALRDLRSDRTRLAEFLTEARSLVQGDACPVCEQHIDHDHVLSRLDVRISQLPEEETRLVRERAALASSARGEQKRSEALAAQLSQLQVADGRLGREAAAATRLVESWAADVRQLTIEWGVRELADVAGGAKSVESVLDPVAAKIRTLLIEAKAVQATDSLAKVIEGEAEANRQRDVQIGRRDAVARVRQALESIARDAKGSEVAIVRAAIERQLPTLRAVYERLQPHPLFNTLDVRFGTFGDRGEVYYRASLGEASGNVGMMFSAAQLNAVAVCVFVTLNLMRSPTGLDLLLLDDPIQNMDDYNVLGLIDLLRSVRASRQLVISTHDDQIGQLFRRKLRPTGSGQRTVTHRFLSSDERGPHVVTTVDEFHEEPSLLAEIAG